MEFELKIKMDNAAMSHKRHVADALRKVSTQLDKGKDVGPIYDENGNTVGYFEVIDPEKGEDFRYRAAWAIAKAARDRGEDLEELAHFYMDKMKSWPEHRIRSEITDSSAWGFLDDA